MNIVFFGGSRFVFPILDVLRKHYNLALVVTTDLHRLAAGKTGPVPSYCKANNIPFLITQQFNNETIEAIKETNAPVAVLAYFGLILPKNVLSLFQKGIINVHPSLLPKYRGPTPVQTAIKNGDAKTGVTLIKLDEEVDHGPILVQVEETISPTYTLETLNERLFTQGALLLEKNLPLYLENKLIPVPQDDTKASLTTRLTRRDGFIDIDNLPAGRQVHQFQEKLDRMIRAYYPWPGVWTKFEIRNSKFEILKFLPGQKLQVEGGKPMSAKDFLNGYPQMKETIDKIMR